MCWRESGPGQYAGRRYLARVNVACCWSNLLPVESPMLPSLTRYYLLDVFTDRPFAGNPLAVFLDADGLEAERMQAIANELNLAETVFVGRAQAGAHFPLRIFTPDRELPFAGHPCIGTAHLLAAQGLVDNARQRTGAGPCRRAPEGDL